MTPRIPKCWYCQAPTPENVLLLSYGPSGEKTPLGYFCGRDCLSFWITEHWDDL